MKTHKFYFRITVKGGKQERSGARFATPESALKTATERAMWHVYERQTELTSIEVWHLHTDGTGRAVYRLDIDKAYNFEHING